MHDFIKDKRKRLKLMCFVMVGIFVFLMGMLIKNSYRQTQYIKNYREVQLREGAKICAQNGENLLDRYIDQLRMRAEQIDLNRLHDKNYLKKQMLLFQKNTYFENVSMYGTDGIKIVGSQKPAVLVHEDYFVNASKGQGGFSKKIYDSHNSYHLKQMRLAVPIYSPRNVVAAILVSDVVSSEIERDLGNRAYDGKCYTSIIDSNGTLIVGDCINFLTSDFNINYFDYLRHVQFLNKQESIDKLKVHIKHGDNVVYHYRLTSVDYQAVYQPLCKNGWYIVMTVPTKAMAEELNYSKRACDCSVGIILLMILFCVVCVIIFYKNLYTMKKKEQEFDTMREVMQLVSIKYDMKTRIANICDLRQTIFKDVNSILQGEEIYDLYDLVMEEDQTIRGQIRSFFDEEENFFNPEIRIKMQNGKFGWFQIYMMVNRNKFSEVESCTVLIQNVDQQISEEKVLMQRAENDLLTKIYNKKTMENKVRDAIKNCKKNEHCIFFIIDLDNFKAVNDTLGHIYGDHVIVDTAEKLKEVFHHHNFLVGRIGGDEFAACAIYQAFDAESLQAYIVKKAEQLHVIMQRVFENTANKQVRVSCSVGIAVVPDDAEDFETLYRKADKALYLSKNSGKDCYHIYDESMEDNN